MCTISQLKDGPHTIRRASIVWGPSFNYNVLLAKHRTCMDASMNQRRCSVQYNSCTPADVVVTGWPCQPH